jgi:pimeloyl-ACP methyl ester carboxylesterase
VSRVERNSSRVPLTDQLLAFARASGVEPASDEPPTRVVLPLPHLDLSVLDWGGPTERPVVFLHGGGLTARTWDVVCLGLRGRFRCLAVDLRGHGDSAWHDGADYRLEAYADDVAEALKQLELAAPVLVGMSLGGQTALLVAARPESTLRGLGLVDVGPEPDERGSRRIISSIDRPQEFENLEEVVRRALVMNPRREAHVLRESLKHNLRETTEGTLAWKYDWRAFVPLTPELLADRAVTLWEAVDRVACPVLIVRGAESDVFSDGQAEELRARLRDAEVVVVEGAGHTVQGDNPAGTKAALEPFLERCLA